MTNLWKLAFAILFVCKEITPVHLLDNTHTKYDLTDVINDAIFRLLLISNNLVENLEPLIKSESGTIYLGVDKINNTRKLRSFGKTIEIKSRWLLYGPGRSHCTIRWEFSKNAMNILCYERYYWIQGHVQVEESYSFRNFHKRDSEFSASRYVFKNLSISATKRSENHTEDRDIFVNISYGDLKNRNGIKLGKHPKLSYKQHLKLIYTLSLELPSIMRNFFTNGGNFSARLNKIFNLHPKQYIISACPDFLTNEQRYYYLIPDIPFVRMSFKNISITGLSNFESYSYANDQLQSSDFIPTVHVKNVGGNMTLDPGSGHSSRFQLNFTIRNLYISFVPKNDQFQVKAQDYSIVEDTPQPITLITSWLSKYSTNIIQLIESAMKDLIMPERKEKPISSLPLFAEIETSFLEFFE